MSASIKTDVQPPGQGCSTLALDLFTDPPIDYSTKSYSEVEVWPRVPVDDQTKIIDFELEASPFFLDTTNVEILFDIKLTLENGDPLPPIHPAPFGEEKSAPLSDSSNRNPLPPPPPPPPPPLPSSSSTKLTSGIEAWALPMSNREDGTFPPSSPPLAAPLPSSSAMSPHSSAFSPSPRRESRRRSASRARKDDRAAASNGDDDDIGCNSDDSVASPKAKRRRRRRRDASLQRSPSAASDVATKTRRRERKRRRAPPTAVAANSVSALDVNSSDDDDHVYDAVGTRSPRNKRRRWEKGRRKHRHHRRRQKRRRSISRRERRNLAPSDPYHSRPQSSPLTRSEPLGAPPPPAPPNPDPPEPTAFDGLNVENCIGLSLFSDIDLRISHQSVQSLNGHYALQSYLLFLTSFGEDWRKSRGELILFDEEPDAANLDCRRPSTYRSRCFLFRNSEYVSVRAPVVCSFNLCGRYLLPMTHVSYHFFLQEPQKCLKTSDTTRSFRYSLRNVRLLCKKVAISDSLNLAIEKRLLSQPAKYYYDQIKTISLIIPSGMREYAFDDVFNGSSFIPHEVYVYFIKQSEALGSFQTSIYNFRQNDVVSASFYCDSKKWPPNHQRLSVKDDDPTGRLAAYANLFNSDDVFSDFGMYIDLQRFCTSMFFLRYTFDFRPTRCADAIQAPALGTVRFNVEFANEIQEPIRCYMTSKHFVHVTLDHQRNLTRDFQL